MELGKDERGSISDGRRVLTPAVRASGTSAESIKAWGSFSS
jgi:hypothetical protein